MHPDLSEKNASSQWPNQFEDPSFRATLPTDEELLDMYVLGGNREALNMLVIRYGPLVLSVVRRMLSNLSDAEDAFQATFLVLVQSARKIRERKSISSWLYGVAYRIARKARQQSLRRQSMSLASLDHETDHPRPESPLVHLSRKIECEALDEELQKLPSHLREPVIEHHILGRSIKEVAEKLEVSATTIEGRLKRARMQLRTSLAKRGASFSVAVAGAAWFQQQSASAAESVAWTTNLIEGRLSELLTNFDSNVLAKVPTFQLAKGELTMTSVSVSKTVVLTGVLSCTVVAISVGALAIQSPPGSGAGKKLELPAASSTSGGLPYESGDPFATIQQREANPQSTGSAGSIPGVAGMPDLFAGDDPFSEGPGSGYGFQASGSQFGGGRPLGSSNMGVGAANMPNALRIPAGPPPEWLKYGQATQAAVENNRSQLRTEIAISATNTPLRQVIDQIEDEIGVQIIIDEYGCAEESLDVDEILVKFERRGYASEVLGLVLEDAGLDYEVWPNWIRVVPMSRLQPRLRYYDLSALSNFPRLSTSIQETIREIFGDDPEFVVSSIGSMLVIVASEKAHLEIEVLLSEVYKANAVAIADATLEAGAESTATAGGSLDQAKSPNIPKNIKWPASPGGGVFNCNDTLIDERTNSSGGKRRP